jgi:V/A-type H+-transporting ATPase subunit D
MAILNVNPTQMQKKTLTSRLVLARRGHKFLKDKCDELIRRYTKIVRENFLKRQSVEKELRDLVSQFCFAKAYMSEHDVMNTFMFPYANFSLNFGEKSVMNISMPDVSVEQNETKGLPYSFVGTNAMFDSLVERVNNLMPKIVELANLEKSCQILSREIEHIKRRVNALEFNLIPNLQDTIKYISAKLEENDRASRIRLLKVKKMIQDKKDIT